MAHSHMFKNRILLIEKRLPTGYDTTTQTGIQIRAYNCICRTRPQSNTCAIRDAPIPWIFDASGHLKLQSLMINL